jgi:hypothetical protein
MLVVVGTVSSFLAASALVRSTDQKSHKGFIASSVAIASTLQLAIQHEQDLIVSASGYIASNPSASNAQFNAWARSVDAFGRYPELVGIGHSVIVSASALPAFSAEAVVDPTGPLAANGTFAVVPAGNRPFYCLSVGSVERSAQTALPAGTDFCAKGPLVSASLNSRSSGIGAYVPIKGAKRTLLSILTPVYEGGVTPTTAAMRQSTFIGWVGMSIVPELLLARSLVGHRNTAVMLHYRAA